MSKIKNGESNNVFGVYVLAPFREPYYTGISNMTNGVFNRVKDHIDELMNDKKCKKVVFKDYFYSSSGSSRNVMIPRKPKPSKSEKSFLPFALQHVLFWREEKVGFMNRNNLIDPSDPMGALINVKMPFRGLIRNVINNAFSNQNFHFFYIQVGVNDFDLLSLKGFLETLETIVKFSLINNTFGDSGEIKKVFGDLNEFGINQVDIVTPNSGIRKLFYSSPHDSIHNPVANLQGIVNII